MTTDHVLVLTTMPAGADAAHDLARTLVGERLAACVNVLPAMRSIYRWQGDVQEDDERQLLIKTTRTQLTPLWTRLRALHPYDTPEFIVLPVAAGNERYLDWISSNAK